MGQTDFSKSEYSKSGFRRMYANLWDFWDEYKRSKTGLLGFALVAFMIFIGITAPLYTDTSETLNTRSHAPYSKPVWLKYFNPGYFPDTKVIDTDFSSPSTLTSFDFKEVDEGDYFTQSATWSPQRNGAIKLTIGDLGKQIEGASTPKATISMSYSFTWTRETFPLDFRFPFITKTLLEGEFTEGMLYGQTGTKAYSVTAGWYIKIAGQPVEFTLGQVEVPVPPREYTEFGLTIFTLYSEIPDWTEMGNSQLQYMEFKDLFTKGRTLTLTFAMDLQITEPNLEQRGVGNFSVLMDKITGIGQSHYFGLMGTTAKGSDLFSLVMRGARISLLIGISATAINIIIGALAGLLAGYYGGITDEFIMRVVDVGLVIPLLPLQIVLISIFQKLEVNPFFPLLLALTVTGWVGSARVIRSQVLVEKKKPYIEAAKASGCPNWHIMIYHIFPNVISLIFMYIMLGITNAILAEAVLSFLGLGPQWVSWGRILQEAALPGLGGGRTGGLGGTLFEAWWNMFFPGIFLTSVSIGFMFTGHTMEEIFQPERRT